MAQKIEPRQDSTETTDAESETDMKKEFLVFVGIVFASLFLVVGFLHFVARIFGVQWP